MSLRETDNQLVQALQALQGRIAALEKGGGAENDDGESRIGRERQERTAQQDLKNFARKQEKPERSPSYTNPKRQEEAVKRHNTRLDAPAPKPEQKKVEKGGAGSGVEFYVWKNGELGKMLISTESGFSVIPPPE